MKSKRTKSGGKVQPKPPVRENALEDLVDTLRTSHRISQAGGAGGSQLADYSTISRHNNYSLITLNWPTLTSLYSSRGIIKTVINLPIQDALAKGIEIESQELSPDQITELLTFMERENQWEILRRAWAWARLYGGGALVINTNQDPSTPLNLRSLHNSPMAFYDVDRWQLLTSTSTNLGQIQSDPDGCFSLHGVKIHSSRVLLAKGESPPYHQRKILRGWSLSECEHIVSALNIYLKTKEVTFELLDEAKVDVFRIKDLADSLRDDPGFSSSSIEKQIQLTNELKSFHNAIILDHEDEYETKQQTFTGLAEIMKENRYEIASVVKMPITKLFGIPAAGFNSGESDLESYNQMVESNIRGRIKPLIRQMMELNMFHLWGTKYEFSLKWPALRSLNSLEEQEIKDSKFTRATEAFTNGLIDKDQWTKIMQAETLFPINLEQPETEIEQPPEETSTRTFTVRKNSTSSPKS